MTSPQPYWHDLPHPIARATPASRKHWLWGCTALLVLACMPRSALAIDSASLTVVSPSATVPIGSDPVTLKYQAVAGEDADGNEIPLGDGDYDWSFSITAVGGANTPAAPANASGKSGTVDIPTTTAGEFTVTATLNYTAGEGEDASVDATATVTVVEIQQANQNTQKTFPICEGDALDISWFTFATFPPNHEGSVEVGQWDPDMSITPGNHTMIPKLLGKLQNYDNAKVTYGVVASGGWAQESGPIPSRTAGQVTWKSHTWTPLFQAQRRLDAEWTPEYHYLRTQQEFIGGVNAAVASQTLHSFTSSKQGQVGFEFGHDKGAKVSASYTEAWSQQNTYSTTTTRPADAYEYRIRPWQKHFDLRVSWAEYVMQGGNWTLHAMVNRVYVSEDDPLLGYFEEVHRRCK